MKRSRLHRIIACVLAALAVAAAVLCGGCYAAYEKAYLTVSSVQGAGERRIDCFFIRDGFVHPDSPAGGTHNNDTYFPQGVQAAVDWLAGQMDGEIFSLTLEDRDDGFHVVTLSYSFDSVEDYNAKTALLASYGDGADAARVQPASLTVSREDGVYRAVWREAADNAHLATAWMYRALLDDGREAGVFSDEDANYNADATRTGGNSQDTLVLGGDTIYTVTVGGETATFCVGEDAVVEGTFPDDGSYEGALASQPPSASSLPDTAVSQPPQQDTNGGGILAAVVLLAAALAITGFLLLVRAVRRGGKMPPA